MLRMIDLFAGIGGIRIAFENNNIECVASSEIDSNAKETYFENFGEMPLGDITKILSEELPEFDVLAGGFPCQPFSIGGLRKGFEDTRGTLFFEIARILKDRQPQAFLLENVSGIVSHNQGNTLKTIEQTLEDLGYIISWKIMNAKDYGIPQNRNRWYCVGFRKELCIGFEKIEGINKVFSFPSKCELQYTLKDIIFDIDDKEYQSTDTAIYNINTYLTKYKDSNRYNPEFPIIANEIRKSRCNFRSDGISPCLTAKMGTGGNNVPVYVHQMRKLTEKECLKIMGFPDSFKIQKNSFHSYKQIGNSVVIPVVQQIVKEMSRVLS